MPYIKKEEREKWKEIIKKADEILKKCPSESVDGEINFLVSSIIKNAYPPKYFNYNRAIGVLECIKQEFYRKQVAPYEDEKERENGAI
jgi:hypothetical protein